MEAIIRVVDFETTGLAPPAQVCEAAYCDLIRDGGVWSVGTPVSTLHFVPEIAPEVRAVHWISQADTIGHPPFDPTAFLEDASHCSALAAHNAEFEDQWLCTDGLLSTICTLKAALRIWPDAPGHSNSVLRCWLEDRGLITVDSALASPAHRAGPDAYVTAHILKAILETGATGRDLVAWTREPRLLPTCPIGKFRGEPWDRVDAGFLDWMLRQPSMEEDLKWNARRELDRRGAC